MAGDWLKMRHDLGDDPATIRIAALCGLDEDAVVGKLHRIWSWADRHTADGHAEGIGLAWVDRTVRCDGFGAAMVSVGWMEETESGMAFPRFDRHCGNTAKVRALAKTRMERSRCAPSATESEQPRNTKGTREEKRREEEENQHARAAGAADETPKEADPEPGTHSSDCQNAAGRPNPARGDAGAAESATGRHGAAGDEWRRAGWVHDEWARVVAVWNRTERAAPWTLATPPNGFAELAAAPGWIETALAAVAMLPECRRFERPVPWTQFVREIDRILAGEFRDPREDRRELAAAGGGAGGRQPRRGNMR